MYVNSLLHSSGKGRGCTTSNIALYCVRCWCFYSRKTWALVFGVEDYVFEALMYIVLRNRTSNALLCSHTAAWIIIECEKICNILQIPFWAMLAFFRVVLFYAFFPPLSPDLWWLFFWRQVLVQMCGTASDQQWKGRNLFFLESFNCISVLHAGW